MTKAILFDMDGVLVDSVEAWFKLFNKTLKHFGKEEFIWERFIERVWGGPIERDAEEFFNAPVKEVINYYFDSFDFFKRNLKLFPDAKETLKELKDRNLKLALVTNTPKEQADTLLKYLGLMEYFDAVVGGDEVKNGKPAPDIMIEACKRLKIEPKDAVFVGDTEMDMMSGRSAGCTTVGFRIDNSKRINDLKELMELI